MVKYSKAFEDVTTAIFFSSGYKQECALFGYSESEEDIYTIIKIPKEYEQEFITILNDNFCNLKLEFRVNEKWKYNELIKTIEEIGMIFDKHCE